MIIVCPQCESRYDVAEESLPEAGRAVRCTRCRAEWTAFPSPDESAVDQTWMEAERAEATLLDDEAPRSGPAEAVDLATPQTTHDIESPKPAARPPRKARARRPSPTRRRRIGHLVLAATAATCVFLAVTRRDAVVRTWPEAAGLYARVGLPVNLRGIDFEEVATSRGTDAGLPVLVVEGRLRNITGEAVGVPRLRFSIRDDKEVELYSWTAVAARNELASGAVLPFKTRLASPPAGGQSVAVRFLRRDDMIAAAK